MNLPFWAPQARRYASEEWNLSPAAQSAGPEILAFVAGSSDRSLELQKAAETGD